MRRVFLLSSALILGFVLPADAELLPRAGKADPRIREVAYVADQVVAIDSTYGTSTMIVLGDDEKIETLALGDSVAWKVEPNHKGNIIFVKPVEKNATSNLNIVTSKRIYAFFLRSNFSPVGQQIFKVRFRYPEDEVDASLLSQAKERAKFPNQAGFHVANANSDYGYKGSSVNRPTAVFDDGVKTFFRFETDAQIPAIFSVGGERNESLANFRREGAYVVVDKVNFQWTLRNGQESTCVFNLRLNNLNEPTGLEPYAPQRIGDKPPATAKQQPAPAASTPTIPSSPPPSSPADGAITQRY